MILGTAGHIDHGKTALVKRLTGVDTDRLPEEKRRGITIDLGFAPLVLDGVGTIGIVDVPGHEAFVRTMLAGASGIDVALLVVAADEGVMPQTREHLQILSLLEIPALVVALTKSDLVDAEWLALAIDDVRSLLAETSFAESSIVAVSSVTGDRIGNLLEAIRSAFKARENHRAADDVFRMPVDRAFTIKGTGTVITGTVWSGCIERDTTVTVFPPGRQSRVRAIQHHGVHEKIAAPGERIALALSNLETTDVSRGAVIVADRSWTPTSRAEIDVTLAPDFKDIGPRSRIRFHLGTSDIGARITRPLEYTDGSDDRFFATIVLDEEMLLRAGDRFVLRLPSPEQTIGGGRIVDPFAARRRKAAPPRNESIVERFERIVSEAGADGIAIDQLPIRLGVSVAEAKRLVAQSSTTRIKACVYDPAVLTSLDTDIELAVKTHVENYPLEPGVKLETLRSLSRAGGEVIDFVVDRLERAGRIEVRQSVVIPAGWAPALRAREQRLADSVTHEICVNESEPPSVSELEAKFGKEVPNLLRFLARTGDLVRVSDDRYYSPKAVELMVAKLRDSMQPGRIYGPAELREVLGVSRKYLIPFLEFCDVSGVTDRKAEGRSLGAG
ncbi:MAG TPA: selenocysteine-specific translation elongation factor [Gemmatimonadaceae bacterium]|nr:selenocysteine-specific translation elongation factor [Gemmatimonadaceae bacterium]